MAQQPPSSSPPSGGPANSKDSAKSAEITALEALEKDLFQRLRETERRIYADEGEYFTLSVTRPDTAASFGNLLSGWEGLLEGKSSDKRRGVERIYSGEGGGRQRHGARTRARALRTFTLTRAWPPTESSESWRSLRRDFEKRTADAADRDRASGAAYGAATARGFTGAAAQAAATLAGGAATVLKKKKKVAAPVVSFATGVGVGAGAAGGSEGGGGGEGGGKGKGKGKGAVGGEGWGAELLHLSVGLKRPREEGSEGRGDPS